MADKNMYEDYSVEAVAQVPSINDLLMEKQNISLIIMKKQQMINTLEAELLSIENNLSSPDLSEKEITSLRANYEERNTRLMHEQAHLTAMQAELRTLEDAINRNKLIDKNLLFQNIRELLKISEVKLGQIERAAGFQPGYMSRLEKPGNMTEPTAEFIATAAKMLNVPVDLLIYTRISEMTPTEYRIQMFFASLIQDTRKEKIIWDCEPVDYFSTKNIHHTDSDSSRTNHPLFKEHETYDNDRNAVSEVLEYDSRFYPDREIFIVGNCYHAKLGGTDSSIYLMRCGEYEDPYQISKHEFYEVYFTDKDNDVKPVCCSDKCMNPLAETLNALYLEIGIAEKHATISSEAWSIMEDYFKSKQN